MDAQRSGRLFVCDSACAMPFGHNVTELKYFKHRFRDKFSEVIALCSSHLPARLVDENGFVPFYSFYYHRYLPLAHAPEVVDAAEAVNAPGFIDRIEALATADAVRLLDEREISAGDSMLFPSVDFYGLIGLLNALTGRPADRQPSLFIRLIGVMENATASYREPLKEFVQRILEARADGVRMSFSAETPKYADFLAGQLLQPVAITPHPQAANLLPMPELGSFVLYCPGSARADKGYFDLWKIFSTVRRADLELTIRFVTQIQPDASASQCENYTSQLYALPGVELLPASITENEMVEHYRNSHAVVLPYDRSTYALRGSAVMQEAAYFGRRIITLEGTGFAGQVQYYGLGDVVPSIEKIPEAILALARQPRAMLEMRAAQACYRFNTDAISAYNCWMGFLA